MAGVNTTNFEYADWITQTVDATRLTRLRLHIKEVSLAIVEASQGRGRSLRLPASYLKDLREDERRLAATVNQAAIETARGTTGPSRFVPRF